MDEERALLLVNGAVWSGGPDRRAEPDSLLVRAGRVAAVGTRGEVEAAAGADALRVDLGGRRVVPGLIDSHLHAVRAGLSYGRELDWTSVRHLSEGLSSISVAAGYRAPGEWITVLGGWHPCQVDEERLPTRDELDEVAPEHPVFVHPLYGHEDMAVLNSAGLAAMGWHDGCADPAEGRLERIPGTERLTGRVCGLGLYGLIGRTALAATAGEEQACTRAFFDRLASLGLTGVVDPAGLGMTPDRYRAVYDTWRRGELNVRVRLLHGATVPGREMEEIDGWMRYVHPGAGDDMLSVLGLGEAVHYGCHDWEAMSDFRIEDGAFEELVTIARRCAEEGWPLSIHAILDSSIGRVLDALEVVNATIPLADLRFTLAHVECIGSRNLARLAELGLGVTVQGRMVHKARVAAGRWGEDVLRTAPPLRDLLDLGVPVAAGTDGTRSASYNPWLTLWWMVTGQVLDGGPARVERHRLTREEALRAYTAGSAWVSFEEDRRGLLEPGYLADLAVLDRDYFTVPADEIPGIASELTLVGGRIVHAGATFDGLERDRPHARPGPLSN